MIHVEGVLIGRSSVAARDDVEYKNGEGKWVKAVNKTTYPLEVTDTPDVVTFEELETKSIRAILAASGTQGQYAGVGVKEWEALSTTLQHS